MNVEYAQQGKFYDDSDGIRAVVEEIAGKSFQEFFHRYVSGTNEIPYGDFLGVAGLQLKASASPSGDSAARFSTSYAIVEIDHATDRQRRIREGVLRGTTD
jgi:predicted metalloprotease with PDZ domain